MSNIYSTKRNNDINNDHTPFVSDYETVITSPAFRRLQDKTQVFPLERNDFIHTRLTHSLETMMIAKKIINRVVYYYNKINHKQDSTQQDFILKQNDILQILEVACLIHDIGNPPFGHVGEHIIRQWFIKHIENLLKEHKIIPEKFGKNKLNDFFHFEGNAQALRVISKLHNSSDGDMNLTFAIINTIMKYTADSTSIDPSDKKKPQKKKLGYFTAEADFVKKVYKATGVNEGERHLLTYLLEASDDIAYLTADIEDAIKKGVVSFAHFKAFLGETLPDDTNQSKLKSQLKKIEENDISGYFSVLRNHMINAARFVFTYEMSNLKNCTYDYSDLFDHDKSDAKTLYKILKNYCIKNIFPNHQILRTEIAGKTILNFLLSTFVPIVFYIEEQDGSLRVTNKDYMMEEKLLSLISSSCRRACVKALQNTKDDNEKLYHKLLMITDFISGMTDSYAHNLYLELSGNRLI